MGGTLFCLSKYACIVLPFQVAEAECLSVSAACGVQMSAPTANLMVIMVIKILTVSIIHHPKKQIEMLMAICGHIKFVRIT